MDDQQQHQWALPQMQQVLPLSDEELKQILAYANSLAHQEAARHLEDLMGDSPQSQAFISSYKKRREAQGDELPDYPGNDQKDASSAPPPSYGQQKQGNGGVGATPPGYNYSVTTNTVVFSGSPTVMPGMAGMSGMFTSGMAAGLNVPKFKPSQAASAANSQPGPFGSYHTNPVIEAARMRAGDEQEMQQALQSLQYKYGIYNSEIEPEHETEWYCACPIHNYQQMKWNRLPILEMWSNAVMYKGEKSYSDYPGSVTVFGGNPYRFQLTSPFGYAGQSRPSYRYGMTARPIPRYHAQWIQQTIQLNNRLNQQAVSKVNSQEPKENIWVDNLSAQMEKMGVNEKGGAVSGSSTTTKEKRVSKFANFKKAMGVKSSEEKAEEKANWVRAAILAEEQGRWPDEQYRMITRNYQEKVGMLNKIAEMRNTQPIQYLHLLRAGYFEPIPVAWAYQASNPLKFSIEPVGGWRGITPAWRGYEDLAEERLYWVLNHREGPGGIRMKPDFISEMNMAMSRMAQAVEPPPLYFSDTDTCMTQHTSDAYSKQVMPPPFHAYDRPERPTDETMILLDVSGSMDFDPLRPVYNEYLITGYGPSSQPKNKDLARAIVRRFTDAMANHDHQSGGYELVTFANQGTHLGRVTHKNLEQTWRNVHFGGGTRVMTGWQKVKELHFQKHAQSATHHPVFGWQAGPETPMLRLLLLLDGEATDMDEFELDLLGLNWAHITIFLIGVDGCPHHHRHANELQRISEVNHHVSFVDAQGNVPERYVTHELLKRHLGYDVSMQEFQRMEELPAYSEI